jgi:adenylate kinase
MAHYIVLLGPPGAGKGTQAQKLCERLGLPHVSSGDLFREHLRNQTELGKRAKEIIDQGGLVPDDVTIGMIRERLSRPDTAAGAVLDGFPRTLGQAVALESMLTDLGGRVDAVLYIRVKVPALVRRLTGRWMCRTCERIYNEDSDPPKVPGVCDIDGSQLYQRGDDDEATVTRRIQVYLRETAPLIHHYRRQGLMVELNGERPIEAVTEALLASLPRELVQ